MRRGDRSHFARLCTPVRAACVSLSIVACNGGAPASPPQAASGSAPSPAPVAVAPALAGLDDLRASCPAGTTLRGPTGPNGERLSVNGRVAAACVSPEGVEEGPAVVWFASGLRASAGPHHQGLKEGPWSFWHDNGRLAGGGDFRGGKPEGPWTSWHDNGQPESRGRYSDGRHEGDFTYWDRNGTVERIVHFESGKATKTTAFRDGRAVE